MSHQSLYPSRRTDLRLASPAHLAGAAALLWLLGMLVHPLGLLAPLGILLLLVAGIAYLIRPKSQTMYWRGRRIDLDPEPGPTLRLYRLLFKR